MIYLTFNDTPSGIYKSQVVDAVNLLRNKFSIKITLVSFVSVRGFLKTRSKIKKWDNSAIVVPMLPKIRTWKYNVVSLWLVKLFTNQNNIIGRGPFAANLALKLRRRNHKVCYDGRGAVYEEAKEYNVFAEIFSDSEVFEIEKKAVLNSNFRIAVTKMLANYWKSKFKYNSNNHKVIPCSLSDLFELNINAKHTALNELGWEESNIILVYSGSTAGWQSFKSIIQKLQYFLESNPNLRILFLTEKDSLIDTFCKQSNGKVVRKWLNHDEVQNYLSIGDYGVLIRDKTITNKVASPVKFAEYLSVGLKVLISEDLGDFSGLVKQNHIGVIVTDNNYKKLNFQKILPSEKQRIIDLSHQLFSKKSSNIISGYQSVFEFMK